MSHRASVSAVALLALLFTGCSVSTEVAPTVPPAATVEATPVVQVQPSLPFSGDCSAVLTAQQLDGLLDEGWVDEAAQLAAWSPSGRLWPEIDAWGTIGGLECSWFAAEGADLPEGVEAVAVFVAPAREIPATFTAEFAEARCDPSYDAMNCRLARVDGDLWIMSSAGWSPVEPPVTLLNGILDAVVQNATTSSTPARAGVTDAWWDLPVCADFTENLGLDEAIGPYTDGYWEGSDQPEDTVLSLVGVGLVCHWFTDSERRTSADDPFYIGQIALAPGGAWQWEALAALDGVAPVLIDGAEHAVIYSGTTEDEGSELFATDGVNLLSVSTTATDAVLADVASRAFSALAAG